MNNTITTDGRQNMAVISPIWQNPAPVSRPCGREEMASVSDKNLHLSKIAAPAYKNLHSSKTASLSDENLYALCKTYGERARIWRQRFAGLLPEVFKRKLYEKKGFHSIFEFSKKLAGMSEEQVRLVLNLEKRFETMPALRSLLTTGKVSVNKLSRIVSIAKPGNEMFLATQVQILSKNAVETLVRDEKFATGNYSKNETKNMNFARNSDSENSENFGENLYGNSANSGILTMNFGDNFSCDSRSQNGSQKSFLDPKVVPGQMCFDTKITKSNCDKNNEIGTLNLSAEVQEKLLELQQKGLDINAIILESLQKREQEIAQRKAEISEEILKREKDRKENLTQATTGLQNGPNEKKSLDKPQKLVSRHIPISIKRILYAEHGTKCSMKTCQKPSEQIHHIQRFSAVPSHDPYHLAPLCKAHHELMHCRDLDYLEIRKKAY